MDVAPLSKYQKPADRIFTREQDLAEQIQSYFKTYPRPLSFGYIMAAIKRKGYQYVAAQFSDIKQSTLDNPPAIFMYRMSEKNK